MGQQSQDRRDAREGLENASHGSFPTQSAGYPGVTDPTLKPKQNAEFQL